MEKTRKGIAAIIFYEGKDKEEFLILRRKKNWRGWEFLKGGRKLGESDEKCLKREIREEIGVSRFKFRRTNEFHSFRYNKEYSKDDKRWGGAKNKVFIVSLPSKRIRIDRNEHSGFKWVSGKEALKRITWDDSKKIFRKFF